MREHPARHLDQVWPDPILHPSQKGAGGSVYV
jgi:hypothetical protein